MCSRPVGTIRTKDPFSSRLAGAIFGLLLFADAGLLGAALVYVLQLGGLFQWSVRQSAEVRLSAVSS